MSQQMAIVTKNLTKQYKNVIAVNNLDLNIPKGTIYGFLGPNGAGKTTTIRMLLGLVAPSKGTLSVLGYDVEKHRDKIVQKIGAIVETPAFYNYLSAEENLKVLAYSSNLSLSSKQINKLIDRVGLTKRGRDKVKTYSLGMKQRLGIAATLLSNPEVLFLDEPTNGLDPAGTVEIRNLISELGAENRTIFLSSHLLNEVEQICSDVIIVKQGEKKLEGKMSSLLAQTKGFLIKADPLGQALSVLKQYPKFQAQSDNEGWLKVQAEPNDIPSVINLLVYAKIGIYQVIEHRNTLENIFLELTGQPQTLAHS
ncbi:MAG: ABC transporter ATP-binding protein [Acidobacteria bacterium]|nr:ABC transporter ATP-binding protein [Acidobacteriota bacterium]